MLSVYEYKLQKSTVGIQLHIAMEKVHGESLSVLLQKAGVLRLSKVKDYSRQLLFALSNIHSKNLVHKCKTYG